MLQAGGRWQGGCVPGELLQKASLKEPVEKRGARRNADNPVRISAARAGLPALPLHIGFSTDR